MMKDDNDNSNVKVLATHESPRLRPQINDDLEAYKSILKDTGGDAFKYHAGYGKIGDGLLNFARKGVSQDRSELFKIIEDLYQTDKAKNKLNGPRLTWLAFQLSEVLEDPNRKIPYTNVVIKGMQDGYRGKLKNGLPILLADYQDVQASDIFKPSDPGLIHELHYYLQPLAVYEGGGIFSPEQYLRAAQDGFFLFGLDPKDEKGNKVHGGVYTGQQKMYHDFIHYYQLLDEDSTISFLSEREKKEYKKYAVIWQELARSFVEILDSKEKLRTEEKKKAELFGFLMLHELTKSIPHVLREFNRGSLVDIARLVAEALNRDLGGDLRRAPEPKKDEEEDENEKEMNKNRARYFYQGAAKKEVKKYSKDSTVLIVLPFIGHDITNPYVDNIKVVIKKESSKDKPI